MFSSFATASDFKGLLFIYNVVGKLFRPNATLLDHVLLKAAVKASLPKNVLYAVVWIGTTVI